MDRLGQATKYDLIDCCEKFEVCGEKAFHMPLKDRRKPLEIIIQDRPPVIFLGDNLDLVNCMLIASFGGNGERAKHARILDSVDNLIHHTVSLRCVGDGANEAHVDPDIIRGDTRGDSAGFWSVFCNGHGCGFYWLQ